MILIEISINILVIVAAIVIVLCNGESDNNTVHISREDREVGFIVSLLSKRVRRGKIDEPISTRQRNRTQRTAGEY